MQENSTQKMDRSDFLGKVGEFVGRMRQEEQRIERAGRLPGDVVDEMASLGLFGMLLPSSVGGLDLDMETVSAAMVRIGGTHPALRVALSGTNGPAGAVLSALLAGQQQDFPGSGRREERIASWLEGMAAGRLRAALAMSEPVGGSRLDLHETKAVFRGGHWHIEGFKAPVTEGGIVDLVLLLAVTHPEAALHRRFSLFAVTREEFEVTWQGPTWASRAQQLAGLSFHDLALPEDRLLGDAGSGLSLVSAALAPGRIVMASAGLGLCRRILSETALRVVGFSSPMQGPDGGRWVRREEDGLSDRVFDQDRLGQMLGDLVAAQSILRQAVSLFCDEPAEGLVQGSHRDCPGMDAARRQPRRRSWMASAAKLKVAETAVRLADWALELLGAQAVMESHPVSIFLRQARMLPLAEGGSHVLRKSLSRNLVEAARTAARRGPNEDETQDSAHRKALSDLDAFFECL